MTVCFPPNIRLLGFSIPLYTPEMLTEVNRKRKVIRTSVGSVEEYTCGTEVEIFLIVK